MMFWEYNQIMHYILDISSINMTWDTNGVMTALGLWVYAINYAMSIYSTLWSHQYVGHAENLIVDAKIMNLLLVCSKCYQFNFLLLHKWMPSWIFRHLRSIKWLTHFSENPIFEEYLYQILCFHYKLTYGFG